MFCQNCGKEITEGKSFCGECGASVNGEVNTNTQNTTEVKEQASTVTNSNSNEGWDPKVYKILSYIGILWLVGIFGKRKNDPSVRFHVGQGIMITICSVALSIVVYLISTFVIANIFVTELEVWGVSMGKTVSGTGLAIMSFLDFAVWGVQILFMILGIRNVCKGEDKELPVIGSHAFYK